jgi:hypothetical protein
MAQQVQQELLELKEALAQKERGVWLDQRVIGVYQELLGVSAHQE